VTNETGPKQERGKKYIGGFMTRGEKKKKKEKGQSEKHFQNYFFARMLLRPGCLQNGIYNCTKTILGSLHVNWFTCARLINL
jgi:hypothetical protein